MHNIVDRDLFNILLYKFIIIIHYVTKYISCNIYQQKKISFHVPEFPQLGLISHQTLESFQTDSFKLISGTSTLLVSGRDNDLHYLVGNIQNEIEKGVIIMTPFFIHA